MKSRSASCLVTAIFAFSVLLAAAAHAVQYLELTARQKERAFSPAVITEGGKTVWLAGHAGLEDASGKSLAGDFDAQVRAAFAAINRTLQRAGGSLDNMVTMTVFIADVRYGDRFVQIRREMFPQDNFPASALITVSGFARPGMLIEIQGVAVIGGK
ncbi:MAG: RidA family protein [Deltaproteobacteria bacterium]|nr:MAG: RidA family protein [Deltaproteobacteria bacterium]